MRDSTCQNSDYDTTEDVSVPGIHPAVHDWVVHRVAHGEPVDDQVDVVNVAVADDGWLKVLNDKVGVLR